MTATFSNATAGTYTVGVQVTDDNGATGTDTATITVRQLPRVQPWTKVWSGHARTPGRPVTLDNTYTSMVVVLTPSYDQNQVPMVARMREVSGNTFEVRLDRTDGQTGAITGIPVHYMVVEEGNYTLAEDGVKMEAVKFTSTRTDENNSWVGEARSYQQSYSQPVVVGQVMSYNDSDWSVFWARGSSKLNPPTNSSLYVGKHVGEDPDNTRANETIGYIVIEAGAGSIGGVGYVAGLGGDTIRGVTDGNGYTYNITHLDERRVRGRQCRRHGRWQRRLAGALRLGAGDRGHAGAGIRRRPDEGHRAGTHHRTGGLHRAGPAGRVVCYGRYKPGRAHDTAGRAAGH